MRVGRGDAERLKASRLPPHPPQCAHWGTCPYPLCPFGTSPLDKGSRPPVGGGLWGRSNREELSSLWDVWIHILGIWVECACWEAGGPSVPPLRRRRGKSGRRAESSRPTEWSAGNGRVRTPTPTGIVGEKRRAHNVRPYKRERGKLPPHPSGLRPATFPPGGRLRGRWEHPPLHRIYKRLCI